MKTGLIPPGTLSAFWVNLTDDAQAPHPSILDIFSQYISRGDDEATGFIVYLIESNLYPHASTEQRAVWVAERIGSETAPTPASERLKAA
jgi:hypothetical protein